MHSPAAPMSAKREGLGKMGREEREEGHESGEKRGERERETKSSKCVETRVDIKMQETGDQRKHLEQ